MDLLALEREAQFGLYFSHFAFDAVRPTLPNTADVGLIHCRDPRYLLVRWELMFCIRIATGCVLVGLIRRDCITSRHTPTVHRNSPTPSLRPISDDALRRWLDSSGPGKVVFVSFGSWLSVEQLPPSAQRAILEAAKSMPGNRHEFSQKLFVCEAMNSA